jgi:alpha-L-fucosidase
LISKSSSSLLVIVIILLFSKCDYQKESITLYTPDWDSLAHYKETPEWFKDAKFGIYCHWGVLSVPAFAHDWHPRMLHIKGTENYDHHVNTYGPHDEFGYHDFIPMFEADSFDAADWAAVYKSSGARFGGVVAEHHDGWSNWHSDINPWNAADMGPHRDLVGALGQALKNEGLKFVTTFHMARNLQIYQNDSANWLHDKSYFPYHPDLPTSSEDSLLRILYGNIPKSQFYSNWLGKLQEVIDAYSPDLIYFDGELSKLPDSLLRQFAAYYINDAQRKNKEVAITHKNGELPKEVSMMDLEKGRMDDKTDFFWLTDETIAHGSWSYTETLEVKPAGEIIHVLIDIVSKNGVLMLNISPKASGVIPIEQKKVLEQIGAWLDKFGEAIYATRTWTVYGEGPTRLDNSGHFLDWKKYTPQDIRFTSKDDYLYAIIMGWPGANKEISIASIKKENLKDKQVHSLEILGTDETIDWKQNEHGLVFTTPSTPPDQTAFVVKIKLI